MATYTIGAKLEKKKKKKARLPRQATPKTDGKVLVGDCFHYIWQDSFYALGNWNKCIEGTSAGAMEQTSTRKMQQKGELDGKKIRWEKEEKKKETKKKAGPAVKKTTTK